MSCIKYQYSNEDGEVFSMLTKDDAICGDTDTTEYILFSGTEYNDLMSLVEFKAFDKDVYDTTFYGVLSMWVAGIAIGLILAQIAKLKR